MSPFKLSNPTTVGHDDYCTAKAQDKELETNFMSMTEALREEIT